MKTGDAVMLILQMFLFFSLFEVIQRQGNQHFNKHHLHLVYKQSRKLQASFFF